MPRDPVCGASVDENTPFAEVLSGETFYFCSEECQEEFDLAAVGNDENESYVEPLPEVPEPPD